MDGEEAHPVRFFIASRHYLFLFKSRYHLAMFFIVKCAGLG